MMDVALVLVHKKPQLGIGKQRLAARLGENQALQVAQALLNCAMEDAVAWPGPVVLAPASDQDYDWAQQQAMQFRLPCRVIPQISGNLGQRLNALDLALRRQDATRLVYIGSDAPGLSEADYAAVRSSLQQTDAVLMPAVDGGVVLMASRCAWPDLSMLPWSTNCLGAELAARCRAEMRSVSVLDVGYDIDEPDDFFQLLCLLETDRRPSRRALYALIRKLTSDMSISLGRNQNA
ncbi:MAG: DUF2064 domain-containing protein [Burkholderiales bacterium]|uniref:TIGR04282 family arsenosugar biosynthesis glycosyltransferase n=1 Tax=Nitrosomonas sp. TaxID=42353 RepID=UPI001D889E87|nr:DUF2064 domain-containing protein [Nitrosomonas sp.]MCB1947993.1 DUF2064 domain-containing protein [Nitrosomonas sp.]MCP5243856.1 DUF2064 domain-containing protein [Burkholderiales bacterium]